MTNDPTAKKLAELDVADANAVVRLFDGVRQQFEKEAESKQEMHAWDALRMAWLGRKSGVLTRITENWLKPAKPELKRAVGQALNELKAHVEAALESRRAEIDAAAEKTALAREREDLSLPGGVRPLGSRHPLRQTFE